MPDVLQLAPQWIVCDDDVARIADAYGLMIAAGRTSPLGGAVNGVVRVDSDAGELVLRVHRPWTTVERLEGVHQVQALLRDAGLPVPPILSNREGLTWTWLDRRLVEVLTFVEGGHEADSWDEFAVSFSLLGRLHAALAPIDPSLVPAPVFASYANPDTALAMLAETDHAFDSWAIGEWHATAADIRHQARHLWQRLEEARQDYAERLLWAYIHGDFLGKNVLLADGRVIALLDFDRLAYRERIHELAVSLYCVLGRLHRSQAPNQPPSDDELARLAGLVAAYETAAPEPLSANELRALPFEMARVPLYPIAQAGYQAAAGDGAGAMAETRAAGWHLPRARWLVDHADHLHEVLVSTLDRPQPSR